MSEVEKKGKKELTGFWNFVNNTLNKHPMIFYSVLFYLVWNKETLLSIWFYDSQVLNWLHLKHLFTDHAHQIKTIQDLQTLVPLACAVGFKVLSFDEGLFWLIDKSSAFFKKKRDKVKIDLEYKTNLNEQIALVAKKEKEFNDLKDTENNLNASLKTEREAKENAEKRKTELEIELATVTKERDRCLQKNPIPVPVTPPPSISTPIPMDKEEFKKHIFFLWYLNDHLKSVCDLLTSHFFTPLPNSKILDLDVLYKFQSILYSFVNLTQTAVSHLEVFNQKSLICTDYRNGSIISSELDIAVVSIRRYLKDKDPNGELFFEPVINRYILENNRKDSFSRVPHLMSSINKSISTESVQRAKIAFEIISKELGWDMVSEIDLEELRFFEACEKSLGDFDNIDKTQEELEELLKYV